MLVKRFDPIEKDNDDDNEWNHRLTLATSI